MRIFESNYQSENGLFRAIAIPSEDVLPYYDVSGYCVENFDYDPKEDGPGPYIQLGSDSDFRYHLDLENNKFFEDTEGTPAQIEPRGLYYSYWDGSNHVYIHLTDSVDDVDYSEITDDLKPYDSWLTLHVKRESKGRKSVYKSFKNGKEVLIFHYESFYQGEQDSYYIVERDKVNIVENVDFEHGDGEVLFSNKNFVYYI